MKKMKMSYIFRKVFSLLLCVAVICSLFSGYAGVVRAAVVEAVEKAAVEPEKPIYTAQQLTLTKGQNPYDLNRGITFDATKYALSATDNGGFDINTVGDYTVSYELAPISADALAPAADSAQPALANTAFTRVVSVTDIKKFDITFKIDSASLSGRAVTFADGKSEVILQVEENAMLLAGQLPKIIETGSQELVFVAGWRNETSGMTYSSDAMTKTKFMANETFFAVAEPATFRVCTCGNGDQSEVHLSACALLQQPANVEVYAAKARGEEAAPAPVMSPRMGRAAAVPTNINVPKGIFYVSPNPTQKTDGTYAWYDTFAEAIAAIKRSNGAAIDYRIILCVDGQVISDADTAKGSALNTLTGYAKSLTISSSWGDPAGADTLWDRVPTSWVPGKTSLNINGAPADAGTINFPTKVYLGVPTTFRNIKMGKSFLINACCNKVVMGEGIENAAGTCMDLFGKAAEGHNDKIILNGDTDIEIFSGKYNRVSGGYEASPKNVTGNKSVKIYGGIFETASTDKIINSNTGSLGTNKLYEKNQVVADSLNDFYLGNPTAVTGTASILVQPMEKLTFVAPPAIIISDYASSKAAVGQADRITLDTRYYKAAIDMSKTVIATAIQNQSGADYGIRNEVVIDINAPGVTLKEIWGRGADPSFSRVYKTTINLNDIHTVTGYITGVNNSQMTSYADNGYSILNVNKTVNVEGVRWFSDVNIASNVNLYTNKLQMVGNGTENYNTPWVQTKVNASFDAANKFSNLTINYNGAVNVLQGGASCMLGDVTAAGTGRLSLTCDSYSKAGTPAGGILFGKITGSQLRITVTPNSAPIAANDKYAFLYVGRNLASNGIQARILPLTKYSTFPGFSAGTVYRPSGKGAGINDYSLALVPTPSSPIILSWDWPNAVAEHATIKDAVAGIVKHKPGIVAKIRIARPYSATQEDLDALRSLTTADCSGLIITGWDKDNGWNIKGDGFLSTPNGETANVDKDEVGETAGSATPHKNTAPQDAASLTLPTVGYGYICFNYNVPTTIRNISIRTISAKPDYIDIKANGNRAQIGPGLQTSNVEYFQVYGGKAESVTSGALHAANYDTDVVIYNGTYRAVMADVYTANYEFLNSGNTKLTIYGGTFGVGDNPAHNIICNVLGLNDTNSTAPHGVGLNGSSTISIYPSAGYDFNLNDSLVIGQAYGNAVSHGTTTINIKNPDGTVFEHFPKVAPLHTTNAMHKGDFVVNIGAPNCTFGTLSASNIKPEGPLVYAYDGQAKKSDVNVLSAKAIDMIFGFGIPESNCVTPNLRPTTVFFKDGCNTEVKSKLYNWNSLVVENAKVNFKGNSGSFYSHSDGTGVPKGVIWFRNANSLLSLEKPQTRIGVGMILTRESGGAAKANGATLLVNGTPTTAGLLINQNGNSVNRGDTASLRTTNIGLVAGVAPQNGTKLLQYANKAQAIPSDYTKHASVSSSIVKGNADAPLNGQGFVYLNPQGSIRVYPAPQNGNPGAAQMRYTDYITLYDALLDMEKYPAPTGKKYTVNFFKDYTLGMHDASGAIAATGNDDLEKLRSFNRAGVDTIVFSSIDQKKPELLSESDMNKLTTVDTQGNKPLELSASSTELQNADPKKNQGIIFESFKFGKSISIVAASGSAMTLGAYGAANGQPGSVRMDNTAFYAYGGTHTSGHAPSARVVVNSGTYERISTTRADGSSADAVKVAVTGSSTIDINGGQVNFLAGTHADAKSTINVNAPLTVKDIWDFDQLNVNKNLVVTVNLWGNFTAGCDGNLTLAPNTVLDLQCTGTMQVKDLTAGNNATIFIPKDGAATKPLDVLGTYTSTGTLITDVKNINKRAEGDNLIVFATARPAKTGFASASMAIEDSTTEIAGKKVIQYGLPNNPATRLVWIEMADSERSGSVVKTLYFDSLNYKTADQNTDGEPIKGLYVLTKEQYDAFVANPKTMAQMTAADYTAMTNTHDSAQRNKVADGIGTGFHTHYYSMVPSVTIDPTKTYYVLTYAGQGGAEAYATGMIDVHAPDVALIERNPVAVRGAGSGDSLPLTINLNVKDFNTGVAPYVSSNIYRIGWLDKSVTGATEPDLTAMFPNGAYTQVPRPIGVWTLPGTTVYADGVPEQIYSFTVTAAQAKSLPKLYLFVQDMVGNTKEIEIVPDWQLTAEITYKPGMADTTAVLGADVFESNKAIDSETAVQKCPDTFVPPNNYAFAGWKVTVGAAGEMGKTYFPVSGKFTITQDTELTAQWLPDTNADKVPDEWQQTVEFAVFNTDTVMGGLNGTVIKSVQISIPQLNADGTYTNSFDPAAATKKVTLLAGNIPVPTAEDSNEFTMWTREGADTTAVTPENTIVTVSATTVKFFAHFKSSALGNPFILQTVVTHTVAPMQGAAATEKKLDFDMGIKTDMPIDMTKNTKIVKAFISKEPTWMFGAAEPIDALQITLTTPNANATTGSLTTSLSGDTWYAYVVTNGDRTERITLDTHAPESTGVSVAGGTIVKQNETAEHAPAPGETATTSMAISILLSDVEKTGATGGYTASGLNKAGWSRTKLTAAQKLALCDLNGFITANGLAEVFPDNANSVTIQLDAPAANDTIFLYTRDMLGNMVEQEVSFAPVYNVSVPTWIGLVAVQGMTDRLINPTKGCYIVNNSTIPVKATITGFAPSTGAANLLTLVDKATPAVNEMNLKILEKDSTLGFLETSVSKIGTTPLELGVMPATGAGPHGVGFQFAATYDPQIALRLNDWDMFTMTYLFEIQP